MPSVVVYDGLLWADVPPVFIYTCTGTTQSQKSCIHVYLQLGTLTAGVYDSDGGRVWVNAESGIRCADTQLKCLIVFDSIIHNCSNDLTHLWAIDTRMEC